MSVWMISNGIRRQFVAKRIFETVFEYEFSLVLIEQVLCDNFVVYVFEINHFFVENN